MMVYFILTAVLVGIDQAVKFWVVSNMALGEKLPFIPHLLSLQYIQNRGAAWGILQGQMGFFFVITIVVVIVLTGFLVKNYQHHWLLSTAVSLILAGAIGNFIDRLFRGYVVDMFCFEFIDFPIFNFADACITVGVVLALVYMIFIEED